MTDDIKLPPLPRIQVPLIEADVSLLDIKVLAQWCERTATAYAHAAVLADRERRAQQQPIREGGGECPKCKGTGDVCTGYLDGVPELFDCPECSASKDAEVEALRAEVERLNRILGRIVEGDGDSTLTIRAGADAFAAAREYLRPNAVEQFIEPQEDWL